MLPVLIQSGCSNALQTVAGQENQADDMNLNTKKVISTTETVTIIYNKTLILMEQSISKKNQVHQKLRLSLNCKMAKPRN